MLEITNLHIVHIQVSEPSDYGQQVMNEYLGSDTKQTINILGKLIFKTIKFFSVFRPAKVRVTTQLS